MAPFTKEGKVIYSFACHLYLYSKTPCYLMSPVYFWICAAAFFFSWKHEMYSFLLRWAKLFTPVHVTRILLNSHSWFWLVWMSFQWGRSRAALHITHMFHIFVQVHWRTLTYLWTPSPSSARALRTSSTWCRSMQSRRSQSWTGRRSW